MREGTVIAALLVGFIARLIGKKLAFLKDMIFLETASVENESEANEQTAGTYGKMSSPLEGSLEAVATIWARHSQKSWATISMMQRSSR